MFGQREDRRHAIKKKNWKVGDIYCQHFGRIGDDWYWVEKDSQEPPEGIVPAEAHGPFSTVEEAEADADRVFREVTAGKITVNLRGRRH
jgi:hypothetical protein